MKKLLLVLIILLTVAFVFGASNDSDMRSTPLTIEFPADGNGGVVIITNVPSTGMWYSVNGGNKISIPTSNYNIPVKSGDRVSLFANGTESTDEKYLNIRCSTDCYLYGNVMSLIQKDNFEKLTELSYYSDSFVFYGLFKDNTKIHNHTSKDIILPATTLADSCYYGMFADCSSLTQAPELPATTLADSCYAGMFEDCTSLTQAPELPASTLAKFCYQRMFYGCTSLTDAPELPATTLAESCYDSMFDGCTSLTQAPELPATVLADWCYANMFYDCTSLTHAPELPASTLASNCYTNMFQGCTSLTRAPELPATTLADSCYYGMFVDCSSLTEAPALNVASLTDDCYYAMFAGCTNLNSITCLAYNPSDAATHIWVYGVNSSGTFTKLAGVDWPIGDSGIPSGWTVVEI